MSPTFSAQDYAGMDDVVEAYRALFAELKPRQREALRSSLPAGPMRDAALQRLESGESLHSFAQAVSDRRLEEVLKGQEEQVYHLADRGMKYAEVVEAVTSVFAPIEDCLASYYEDDSARAVRTIRAINKLLTAMLIATGRSFARRRETLVEEAHQEIIRELSTPVIEVWQDVLVMPLVGIVDSTRAKQMMDQLLTRIVEHGSRIVLLDVTGVPTVDTAVANHLIKTAQAARLVGARSILVGISPQVAQALVRLGVSLQEIETAKDLLKGLMRALDILGYQISQKAHA